jgi:hypothetical protein
MVRNDELAEYMYGIEEAEAITMLIDIYRNIAISSEITIPDIDILYNIFRERWVDKTYDFVVANADAYALDLTEFTKTNYIYKLEEVGFVILKVDDVHDILNRMQFSFRSKEEIWNTAVIEVW